MQREKNLRIERAQRADLQVYRELTKAAEERRKLASARMAKRLKNTLPTRLATTTDNATTQA